VEEAGTGNAQHGRAVQVEEGEQYEGQGNKAGVQAAGGSAGCGAGGGGQAAGGSEGAVEGGFAAGARWAAAERRAEAAAQAGDASRGAGGQRQESEVYQRLAYHSWEREENEALRKVVERFPVGRFSWQKRLEEFRESASCLVCAVVCWGGCQPG
jgi:hypothetical protein